MNLLFNLESTQPLGAIKYHGGGKYAEIVFFRMLERGVSFACYYDSGKWISPDIPEACRKHGIPLYDVAHTGLAEIIATHNADTIFSPLLCGQLFNITGTRVIFPIHDLRSLTMPADPGQLRYRQSLRETAKSIMQLFFPKLWLKHYFRIIAPFVTQPGNTFYTVSYYSKYSLLTFFPQLNDADVRVFYSPDTTEYARPTNIARGDYFLMVSGARWVKNNLRAIIALDRLMSEGRLHNYKAVITGANARNFRYTLRNPERFEFPGYVDEQQLTDLYANCYAFIFPSLSEGFGYPPVEAMKYGKPVIASPISSISEVCGDAAIYFNPFDTKEIYNRILMLLNEDIYKHLESKSRERFDYVSRKQASDLDALIDFITV